MKTDRDIRHDVMEEFDFDPSVTAEKIGVAVQDGIVTLGGTVPTYVEKIAAEKAALRVAGVRAVVEDLKVDLITDDRLFDIDIARAAADALSWNVCVPADVQVSVEDGRVILRGDVTWAFQREAATNALKHLKGVREIVNHLHVRKRPQPADVKNRIEKALVRTAIADANHIAIDVSGGKVTLRGKVHSYSEVKDARTAAWSVPGVTDVDTQLSFS